MEDQYSVLIRFDGQDSTDKFYQHFNGKQFNSMEAQVCHVHFTADVQFTGYSGSLSTQPSPASSTEQPSCPVCLERLDQDTSGILTTMCNHSFHCSCISRWTGPSCPVCRRCCQEPEKSICVVCQTSENLWMCLLCGFLGCGSHKEGHAIIHWKETQHRYSLELETQRVWNYAGNRYVYRLIQSITNGNLVEWKSDKTQVTKFSQNRREQRAEKGKEGLNSSTNDSGAIQVSLNDFEEIFEFSELIASLENQALDREVAELGSKVIFKFKEFIADLENQTLDSEVEALDSKPIVDEHMATPLENQTLNIEVQAIAGKYNRLLATRLENQKLHYEILLQEIEEETGKSISEAVSKATSKKLQKMQSKLDRCVEEKKLLDVLNEILLKNREIWKAKILEVEEREKKTLSLKDDRIRELEEQVAALMADLDAEKTPEQLSISDEIKDGTVLPISLESSTSNAKVGKGKKPKSKRRG